MYAPALIVGDMIHVSGHVPWLEGGGFIQVTPFANKSLEVMINKCSLNELTLCSLNITSHNFRFNERVLNGQTA